MQKEKKIYQTRFLHEENGLDIIKKLDFITYTHSLNVACYAVQFNKSIGYNFSEPLVYYSGLFHDIGKTQIDARILNKTSPLHKDEFDIIKQHPTIGYSILLKANFPNEILEAVQFHHERYDGEGYPMGIETAKIPLIARIISICDVFDALTSNRPYRKAYSMDEALQIMSNSTGQFDPELFSVFILKIFQIVHSNELLKKSGNIRRI